jgi:hypothetical protein
LFSAAPQISPAGVLTFTPAPRAFGNSTCSAVLRDSEGASSAARQFTVNVLSGACDVVGEKWQPTALMSLQWRLLL